MAKYECFLQGKTYYIPDRMMDGIDRYINEGVPPGNFLTAIICNDLCDAFGRADDENFHNVPAYVNYFYNEAPAVCWGSRKKMDTWMKHHHKRRKENVK